MDVRGKVRLLLLTLYLCLSLVQSVTVLRWCVVNSGEKAKCEDLAKKLKLLSDNGYPEAAGKKLLCQQRRDIFECMEKIQTNDVDIIALDPGQGFYAGKYHYMHPIMAETYNTDTDPLKFYAVAVVDASSNINIRSMAGLRACFPGIGTAAGWIYPIATLLKKAPFDIKECNAIVKSVSALFSSTCLPGGLDAFYNQFGNNPNSICDNCAGVGDDRCTTSDPYAGYDGAFNCLQHGNGDIAFVRDNTVEQMLKNDSTDISRFKLVCTDGSQRAVSEYRSCNWGSIPSHIVMASRTKNDTELTSFKDVLKLLDKYYGSGKKLINEFNLFDSTRYNNFGRRNLLFTDGTTGLSAIDLKKSYYTWVGPEFLENMAILNKCPLRIARWCVTSKPEKEKCEDMMMSFKAKNIFPQLDCILADNAIDCMKLIYNGDADLVSLDAGDVYTAGNRFDLVPIAAEDYGDMTMSFYVVAIAKKTESHMTLFNMRQKRACQAGVGRGDGWIIPLGVYIDTEQFIPHDCSAFRNIGELFIRACIPGVLDPEYNIKGSPVNLCEACGAEGFRKCLRTSEEQYYGANGAFRCLVESGGDVAFVRHLTPRDNTDGRNHAKWARNRRSDDYELLCKGGGRTDIDDWKRCNLGKVPANAVVTGGYKSEDEREIFWNLLNYGQQFFSSDRTGDFHMFDSGTFYTDLLFTDAAVRLMYLPLEKQSYTSYLGPDFIGQVETLKQYTCMPVDGSDSLRAPLVYVVSLATLLLLWLSH